MVKLKGGVVKIVGGVVKLVIFGSVIKLFGPSRGGWVEFFLIILPNNPGKTREFSSPPPGRLSRRFTVGWLEGDAKKVQIVPACGYRSLTVLREGVVHGVLVAMVALLVMVTGLVSVL